MYTCAMSGPWSPSLYYGPLGTAESILICELSEFQDWFYMIIAGINNSHLIKKVSMFQGCPYSGVPCISVLTITPIYS